MEVGVAELGCTFNEHSGEMGCLGAKSDSLVIFKNEFCSLWLDTGGRIGSLHESDVLL